MVTIDKKGMHHNSNNGEYTNKPGSSAGYDLTEDKVTDDSELLNDAESELDYITPVPPLLNDETHFLCKCHCDCECGCTLSKCFCEGLCGCTYKCWFTIDHQSNMTISELAPADVKWVKNRNLSNSPKRILNMNIPSIGNFALNLIIKAKIVERRVTESIIESRPQHWKIEGIENRIKSPMSLLRKIKYDIKYYNKELEEVEPDMNDVLRYTYVSPTREKFAETVQETLTLMESKGYKCEEMLNIFRPGLRYRGFHSTLDSELIPFEIQFHTAQSYRVSKITHPIYEISRRLPPGHPAKRPLEKRMVRLSGKINAPLNLEKITVNGLAPRIVGPKPRRR
jgi:hypothetical protein